MTSAPVTSKPSILVDGPILLATFNNVQGAVALGDSEAGFARTAEYIAAADRFCGAIVDSFSGEEPRVNQAERLVIGIVGHVFGAQVESLRALFVERPNFVIDQRLADLTNALCEMLPNAIGALRAHDAAKAAQGPT